MKRRTFLKNSILTSAAATILSGNHPTTAATTPMQERNDTPMFDYPIVDTHVHFWDKNHLHYHWIRGNEILNQDYQTEEYAQATEGIPVGQIVFVQAECLPGQAVAEVDYVTALSEKDPRIQGIVATAPLELGRHVNPTLEYLAQNPLMRGIRRLLQQEADIEYCLRPEFIQGIQSLEQVNFSFDFGINRRQLPAARELARQCPNIKFIICHLAPPDIRNQNYDPWQEDIKAIAELPNVYCKISGVATAADHQNWTVEDIRFPITHVLECFGFNRTAFGSDWPVMLLATEYRRWVEALREVISGCSEDEERMLFQTTAREFYRLEE